MSSAPVLPVAPAFEEIEDQIAHADVVGFDEIPPALRDPLVAEFRGAVRVGLSKIPRVDSGEQPVGRCLLECLRDRQDDVLRFACDLNVWPTNNQSERDLRPFKTQQKISGRLTSDAAECLPVRLG